MTLCVRGRRIAAEEEQDRGPQAGDG